MYSSSRLRQSGPLAVLYAALPTVYLRRTTLSSTYELCIKLCMVCAWIDIGLRSCSSLLRFMFSLGLLSSACAAVVDLPFGLVQHPCQMGVKSHHTSMLPCKLAHEDELARGVVPRALHRRRRVAVVAAKAVRVGRVQVEAKEVHRSRLLAHDIQQQFEPGAQVAVSSSDVVPGELTKVNTGELAVARQSPKVEGR